VRAKKANRGSGSISYLLSLDRTLRKVSLRKIVDRVRPARKRAPARAASKTAGLTAKRTSAAKRRSRFDRRAIAVAALCVVAAVALMAARQPSSDSRIAGNDSAQVEQFEGATSFAEAGAAPRPRIAKVAALVPAPKPAAAPRPAAPAPTLTPEPTPEPRTVDPAGTPVTIAGCLEQDDDTFWLKNTSGEGAPKARSWKSGFFKKRTSSVALLDVAHRFRLASHVGQRVETTGLLLDREMRVSSLRVQGTCD
jgi:hypothetical protein